MAFWFSIITEKGKKSYSAQTQAHLHQVRKGVVNNPHVKILDVSPIIADSKVDSLGIINANFFPKKKEVKL